MEVEENEGAETRQDYASKDGESQMPYIGSDWVEYENRKPSTFTHQGILGRLLFWVSLPVLKEGYKRQLGVQDIPEVPRRESAEVACKKLQQELKNAPADSFKPYMRAVSRPLVIGGLITLAWVFFTIWNVAFTLEKIIEWLNDETAPTWHGYVLAVGLALGMLCQSVCFHQAFAQQVRAALQIKNGVTAAVYEKALTLDDKSLSSAGDIVNIVSNDAWRLNECFRLIHWIWCGTLSLFVVTGLLWMKLEFGCFAVFVIFLGAFPTQGFIGKMLGRIRVRSIIHTDARVRKMSEILTYVQLVKMYAWEVPFSETVASLRTSELYELRKASFLKDLGLTISWAQPSVAMALALIIFVAAGNELDAQTAFTSLALIETLRMSSSILPLAMKSLAEGIEAAKRISNFLLLEEYPSADALYPSHPGLRMDACSFSYELDKRKKEHSEEEMTGDGVAGEDEMEMPQLKSGRKKNVLTNVSIELSQGETLAVVGPVGCGKSSLLSAIIGQLQLTSGAMERNPSIAYVPQQAFIINATIRDNILFGLEYEEERYLQVLYCCCLQADLEQFEAGDMTEIGERGINISGGQKQRVSIARAAYSHKSLVLLDDPLSAVDQHVAQELFVRCIDGIFSDRTVVLVTHQTQYLSRVDKVLVLDSGSVSYYGPPSAAVAEKVTQDEKERSEKGERPAHEMSAVSRRLTTLEEVQQDPGWLVFMKTAAVQSILSNPTHYELSTTQHVESKYDLRKPGELKRRDSFLSNMSRSVLHAPGRFTRRISRKIISFLKNATSSSLSKPNHGRKELEEKDAGVVGQIPDSTMQKLMKEGKLVSAEEQHKGGMDMEVVLFYVLSMGHILFILALIFFYLSSQTAKTLSDWWLARWVSIDTGVRKSEWYYVGMYSMLVGSHAILLLIRNHMFVYGTLTSSTVIHNSVFASVLRAPMSFFNQTPVGRILNRFSKDQDLIDDMLPFMALQTTHNTIFLLAMMIYVSIIFPYLLAVFAPLAAIFWYIGLYYRRSSRELKRLDGITRSPVYAFLQETLSGLQTIRAYSSSTQFRDTFFRKLDVNQAILFSFEYCARWIGMHLDLLTVVVVFFAGILAAILKDSVPPGEASLVISYTMLMAGTFQWAVRTFAETESFMTSVERLLHYARNLEHEAPPIIEGHRPPPDWPAEGKIGFENVEIRYKEDSPPVLKDLTWSSMKEEKIGVVGRTGAGKSTLMSAIFRLMETSRGRITIDGLDISEIGLEDLRRKLSVIPQDPVLFGGTVRYNLSPFGEHSDEEMWDAIRKAHLFEFVQSLPGQLDFVVADNGSNVSVGQRQLFCIARVLLRNNKVLILDEATAAIDYKTDQLVQRTLRESFKNCTILSVAHRIHTIIDNDRVMVLSAGQLLEMDSPKELLDRPDGAFLSLVENTGKKQTEELRRVANGELSVFDVDLGENEYGEEVPEKSISNHTASNDSISSSSNEGDADAVHGGVSDGELYVNDES